MNVVRGGILGWGILWIKTWSYEQTDPWGGGYLMYFIECLGHKVCREERARDQVNG